MCIRLDDADAVVRIRRIEEIGDDDWRLYGVEFGRDRPGVPGDWVNGLLDARRPDSRTLGWDRAE